MKKYITAVSSAIIILLISCLSSCDNGLVEQAESIRAAAISPVIELTLSDSSEIVVDSDLDFGQVSVGSTCDIIITISNKGQSRLDMDLSNIKLTSGPDTEDGSFTIVSLPDGGIEKAESTAVSLRFSPESGGDKSASVSIPSNDYKTPLFTFTLGGSGWSVVLTTAPVSTISTTTAAGGGNISSNGGIPLISKGICWSTSPNPTTSDNKAVNAGIGIGTYSDLMTGLSPGTLYYVRAYADNGVGIGYGSQVSFTTLPATPAVPSVATVGYPSGSGKLAVSWAPVGGSSVYYDLYINTADTIPGTPEVENLSAVSYVFTGLTNYNDYYVWVIAENTTGESGASPSGTGMVGVKVESIFLNKSSAVFLPESSEQITAVVSPENATNPNVNWSTNNAACALVSAGLVTGGNSAGTAVITASAEDGEGAAAVFSASLKAYVQYDFGPSGGKLIYDKGNAADGWRYLEMADEYIGNGHPWRIDGAVSIPGAFSHTPGAGKENTDAIIAAHGAGTYMAMDCRNYTKNGYSDWYMPNAGEANLIIIYLGSDIPGLWGVASSSQNTTDARGCWTYHYIPNAWGWDELFPTTNGSAVTFPVRRF